MTIFRTKDNEDRVTSGHGEKAIEERVEKVEEGVALLEAQLEIFKIEKEEFDRARKRKH